MMTRGQRRRWGLVDPPVPCFGSGDPGPGKRPRLDLRACTAVPLLGAHQLRSSTDGAFPASQPLAHSGRRDWANLTTELLDDIAVRLLSLDVSEYLRFRAVCKPWRELTEDPRARDVLESRFRPHGWFPLLKQGEPPSGRRLLNTFTMACVRLDLEIFCTSHLISVVDGLLVMCDKARNTVRLLHPFTGMLADFSDITDVRPYGGAEPNARLGMDAFKAHFPGLGADPNAYLTMYEYKSGYPAIKTVMDFANIDDSTSPPTLHLCVKNGSWLVIGAKPGGEHWVTLDPCHLRGNTRTMLQCAILAG